MSRFDVIAFDADDTLWHNERLYANTQAKFRELLAQYHNPEWIDDRLYQTEMRNLEHFGYGIKAFTLSMIETAIELTEGRIAGRDLQVILDAAKEMLTADVELLESVSEIIPQLANSHPLMIITKGDLRDQENKITRSGLAGYFRYIEIVSDKNRENYAALLKRYSIPPDAFLMIGNSLRSDILPVLELGASAVYIPYLLTWSHETADIPTDLTGYHQLEHIGLLPGLIEQLERNGQ